MTTEDDIARLAELGRDLPALELDPEASDRIARRTRDDVGKGPSPRRFIEPALAAVLITAYVIWLILKLLELIG